MFSDRVASLQHNFPSFTKTLLAANERDGLNGESDSEQKSKLQKKLTLHLRMHAINPFNPLNPSIEDLFSSSVPLNLPVGGML